MKFKFGCWLLRRWPVLGLMVWVGSAIFAWCDRTQALPTPTPFSFPETPIVSEANAFLPVRPAGVTLQKWLAPAPVPLAQPLAPWGVPENEVTIAFLKPLAVAEPPVWGLAPLATNPPY